MKHVRHLISLRDETYQCVHTIARRSGLTFDDVVRVALMKSRLARFDEPWDKVVRAVVKK